MEKILPNHLPEIIFSSSNTTISKQISKLEREGKITKIAARIYTSNLEESAESIIKRNLLTILGQLYPGSMLSHRSAFEYKPTSAGHIFLTYTYTKKISLPGITLHFMKGLPPIAGDNPITGELYASQKERAFLENLQVTRRQGPESKTLEITEIEEKLDTVIKVNGEDGLNQLRDKARIIAKQLNMQPEFIKLNKLISAFLATHTPAILSSPLAKARAFGAPFDSVRIELFEKLFIELMQHEYKLYPEKNNSPQSFRNFAFFESYFSNYIEGTEFELEDAKKIIETNIPMHARHEDSHDVLGTYKLVSNKMEMKQTPEHAEQLLEMLKYRHAVLLSARKDKNPGQFKEKNNRAGNTHFVDVKLMRGTLIKGFDFYKALSQPFAKAAYIMFLISEVHPFVDGNGRIARIMMNAELVKEDQSKIIIPTVYREDYLDALRRLSRQQGPALYIKMLQKAHKFSANIYDDNMDEMQKYLVSCHAFQEPTEAKFIIAAR